MKVNGKMIKSMVTGLLHSQVVTDMREISKMINTMEMGFTQKVTDDAMKVNTRTEKNKVRAYKYSVMEIVMKACGIMA